MAEPPSAVTLLVEIVAPDSVMDPAEPVVTPVGAVAPMLAGTAL